MTPFVPPSIPARRPHPAAWLVLAIAFLAQSIGSTSRTLGATTPPMFQAHGSERAPMARTNRSAAGRQAGQRSGPRCSCVRSRTRRGTGSIPIGSIVHGLGSRGSQLAILLPGGDWRTYDRIGILVGPTITGQRDSPGAWNRCRHAMGAWHDARACNACKIVYFSPGFPSRRLRPRPRRRRRLPLQRRTTSFSIASARRAGKRRRICPTPSALATRCRSASLADIRSSPDAPISVP